ncbi:MAG: methyltransferase domain-containing protein [Actinobacteria bacterium]|nr:methyltransferase domain-containing protein [Actinomycetota bacterium]
MHEIVNVEQAAAWDGDEGAGWAANWEHYDRSLQSYRGPILTAAAITDGERVLDVGCGNGQSTRDMATATPSGSVLGVDLSSQMLAKGRELTEAAGLRNVEYVQADAQVHRFGDGTFDLAMSRFGSMFFADKVAAFANIARALRPGGRLLLVVWQSIAVNEQFRTMSETLSAGRDLPKPPPTAPSPFAFADPELGRGWLTDAGFSDIKHEPVTGDFYFGANAAEALAFACQTSVARGLLGGLDDATKETALAALHDAMRSHETSDGVLFKSATWFITAHKR